MILACVMLVGTGWQIQSWLGETRVQGGSTPSTEHHIAAPDLVVPIPLKSPEESSQSRVAHMRTLNVIEGW